jgi:uncharacterized repeat protein (TIGR01451 family)
LPSHEAAARRGARRATLRGKVMIGGRVVPRAARVIVLRPGSKTPVTEPAVVQSSGSYRIDDLEPGNYTLKAVDKSHPPAEYSNHKIVEGDGNIVDFELKEPKKKMTLRGRVGGTTGRAATALRVVLYSPEGVELEAARLDANGDFNIEELAAQQDYRLALASAVSKRRENMLGRGIGLGGIMGRAPATADEGERLTYSPLTDAAALTVAEETEMQLDLRVEPAAGARRTLTVRNVTPGSQLAPPRRDEMAAVRREETGGARREERTEPRREGRDESRREERERDEAGSIPEDDRSGRRGEPPPKDPKVFDKADKGGSRREEPSAERKAADVRGKGGKVDAAASRGDDPSAILSGIVASSSGLIGRHEPGVELSFRSSFTEAGAGERLLVPFEITNKGESVDSFRLETNLPPDYLPLFRSAPTDGAEVGLSTTVTPPLAPQQSLEMFLQLTMPETSVAAEKLLLTVRAIPLSDPRRSNVGIAILVVDSATLSLAVAASRDSVRPGETVTQTITVRNQGTRPARAVRADFIVSPGLEFISAEPRALTYDVAARTVVWSLGDLGAGAQRRLKVTFRVLPNGVADELPLGRGLLHSRSLPASVIFAGTNVRVKLPRN